MKDDRDPTLLYNAINDARMKYGCTFLQAADAVEAWREQGMDACSTPFSDHAGGLSGSQHPPGTAPQNGSQRRLATSEY